MSMRDRHIRDRDFQEAKDRIPSSVADADRFYDEALRTDQARHQSPGTPYLENGKEMREDFLFQDAYAT